MARPAKLTDRRQLKQDKSIHVLLDFKSFTWHRGGREASQKEEENPTDAARMDVFYMLLTNDDEVVEKWKTKERCFWTCGEWEIVGR